MRYEDYRKYGEDYYNNVNPGETVEEHAIAHFETYQRHNCDSLRKFLNRKLPPSLHYRWLDVGGIGYATTFKEFHFTTIEPDARIVSLGKRLFKAHSFSSPLSTEPSICCNTIDNFKPGEKYDGIIFHNSFYCLPFPLEGLSKAFDLLKENGELLITISTYFCNAKIGHIDGRLSRIEDLLPGTTLRIFHNAYSLEYLSERAGFTLVEVEELDAYGRKTMMLFRFRRSRGGASVGDKELLNKSKLHMLEKQTKFFDFLAKDSKNSLKEINRSDCFIIGSLQLLSEVSRGRVYPCRSLCGFVLFDTPRANIIVEGVKILGWDDFTDVIKSAPILFDAAVLSFKFQDEILGNILKFEKYLRKILKLNRKSGMETFFINFKGRERFSKGLKFVSVSG